jgi:hypothetical protein
MVFIILRSPFHHPVGAEASSDVEPAGIGTRRRARPVSGEAAAAPVVIFGFAVAPVANHCRSRVNRLSFKMNGGGKSKVTVTGLTSGVLLVSHRGGRRGRAWGAERHRDQSGAIRRAVDPPERPIRRGE